MNIYEVSSWFYSEKECDNVTVYNYVTHEKQFSKKEFKEMCKRGIASEKVKDCFDLTRYLVDNFGFEEIKPIAMFEFEEE